VKKTMHARGRSRRDLCIAEVYARLTAWLRTANREPRTANREPRTANGEPRAADREPLERASDERHTGYYSPSIDPLYDATALQSPFHDADAADEPRPPVVPSAPELTRACTDHPDFDV
jgi:hypothetical protein